jgi:putative oxidoreductase
MSAPTVAHAETGALALVRATIAWLEAVPYWLLALPLRVGISMVFWNSAQAKLASWDTALYMFAEEFKLPVLPPELAAYMATGIELTTPVLLWIGLATRASAAVLLGMTLVIELFVYPLAWPTHLMWAAMLAVLLCYGPGKLSLDWLIRRRVLGDV